jgi:hypothetical protein
VGVGDHQLGDPFLGGGELAGRWLKDRLNAKRKKGYTLDPDVPFVLVVGDHDPFCGDSEFLLAIYGRDWEAMVGARPPLWQQDRKAAGFFGIGKGERPYSTRFSAVAAIGGSRPLV